MRKTRILLLAGTVLPAFAIAAPSFAAPLASDRPMVVAQADEGGKEQRREERQQQRQERQEQRQQERQERQQTREERPSREERQQERQQTREERPSREERQQTREDRPSREERQQAQERPSREERQQERQQQREERQQTREDRPNREERQQTRDAEREQRKRDQAASPDKPASSDKPAAGGSPSATGGGAGSGSDARSEDRKDRAQQMREDRQRDRANDANRPNATGGGAGSGPGSDTRSEDRKDRAQMREDRERERANDGGRPGADRPSNDRPAAGDDRREDARDRRDDRQERREDARQDNREERLRERLRDERRDNERLEDRVDRLKDQRRETRDGSRIIITEPGGRRIIRDGDRVIIRRDEAARFRFGVNPRDIREERRGGEIRTVVTRPDGSRVVTVTDEDGRLIRRVREYRGQEYVLIDNRPRGGRDGLFINLDIAPPRISVPRERYIVDADVASERDISEAFDAPPVERLERSYSLDEIRQSAPLRQYVRSVDLDSVTFDTGSWYVRDDQISKLEKVGQAMEAAVKKNPRTVFMVEGHTDAVGSDEDNLSLSDRRAEAVAEVLTKYFDIPAENLTTQGYGEQYLKVQTDGAEERNRRVTVRNITTLLSSEK
ncbi:OmpA family protein [Chenggangzhangella methanolivorans]|uniref:OmpA family protein n=1 Tax=Chenggangzhangella methanolivorans TaxID=1437009 RepID=A0A9E6RA33_9HYPH|nr:OmpA family protein [Chenggangzhangella methanolivorans]QZO00929.1 OmpA family protein [Chenggangzhangella methanolivorans]